MSYQANIAITTTDDKLFGNINNVSIANAFRNIGKHFQDVAIGSVSESVIINSGPVRATGTISIATGNMSSADTVVINGTTLTAETTPTTGVQFKVGASALQTAINLTACINNNQIVLGVTATYARGSVTTTGVVTVTALASGTTGNYAWSQSGSNVTLLPASALGGGANGPVSATSTWTFSSTGPTNGETCTVANITFTAETSGATGNQFNISSTPATVAANFAAAINGSTNLKGIVTASAGGTAVVTLTSVVPGLIGNGIETGVGTLANTVVVAFGGSGAVAGTNANVVTLHKGL